MTKLVQRVAFTTDEEQEGTSAEFRQWVEEILAHVPAEYADSARVKISAREFYDSPYVDIKVTYQSPETEVEAAQREHLAARHAAEHDARERAAWERLRTKYGR